MLSSDGETRRAKAATTEDDLKTGDEDARTVEDEAQTTLIEDALKTGEEDKVQTATIEDSLKTREGGAKTVEDKAQTAMIEDALKTGQDDAHRTVEDKAHSTLEAGVEEAHMLASEDNTTTGQKEAPSTAPTKVKVGKLTTEAKTSVEDQAKKGEKMK